MAGKRKFDRDAITDKIAEGLAKGIPVTQQCQAEGMPHWNVVSKWMAETPEIRDKVARARSFGYDRLAAECLSIANDAKLKKEDIEKAKLQIETRLKLLKCWDPQRYGDRIMEDKEVRVTVTVNDPTAAVRAGRIIEQEVSDNATQARRITQDDQQ